MSSAGSLRERQAAVVRDEILDALARGLDREDPEDIAMPQVAADAGISLRTLYRYFPTREDMFEAVGDHVVARLGLPREIRDADDIVRVFTESARLGARSPELVRAMLWTRLGRRARSSHRRRRVDSISAALAEVTSHLPAAEARRRAGAVVYLASLPAWLTVSEECELSAEDAQRGVAWAIETLIAALRRENQAHDAEHLSQGGDHHDGDDSD
jgi:AcrR family transcriptional regulator